jgi:hypothetical protein
LALLLAARVAYRAAWYAERIAAEEQQRVDLLLAQYAARVAARVAFQALFHILSKGVKRPPTPERVLKTQKRIRSLHAVHEVVAFLVDTAWTQYFQRLAASLRMQMAWRCSAARGRRAAMHCSAMMLSFTLNSFACWQAARKRFAGRGMLNEPLYRRWVVQLHFSL